MPKQIWSTRKVAIVGVGATPQGAHPTQSAYQLGVTALKDAMGDCGLTDKHRLDGVFTAKQLDGTGIDPVQFSKAIGINPRATGALDYGTAGFTTQYGAMMIASGVCDIVACVYARNLPGAMVELSGGGLYDANHGYTNAHGAFALGWSSYVARHKPSEELLGNVLITARRYAAMNPIAAWPEQVTMEQYLADPYLIWPLRSLDICKVSAGGVAIILASEDVARDMAKAPVWLKATGRRQAPRLFENDDHLLCYPMRDVAGQVYGETGLRPSDIDVLFMSDPCTTHIVHSLENYGFCDEGGAEDFIKGGNIWLDGKTPVNPNGGQLGEGYLVGWLHHVELARQLRNEAGPRQIRNARIAQYTVTGRQREDYLSSIYAVEQ